jgi:hypothetical protein
MGGPVDFLGRVKLSWAILGLGAGKPQNYGLNLAKKKLWL